MRTSASCRRSKRPMPAPAGGFTLLEMLVVLVITSLTVALIVPRLAGTVAAIQRSGDRAEVVRQLQELPMRARQDAAAIVVPAQADLSGVLQLPEGWSAVTLTPLQVKQNGICLDTSVQVVPAGGSPEEWRLAMPDCAVVDAP